MIKKEIKIVYQSIIEEDIFKLKSLLRQDMVDVNEYIDKIKFETPLTLSLKIRNKKIINLLLTNGGELSKQLGNGHYTFMYGAKYNDEVFNLCLEYCPDYYKLENIFEKIISDIWSYEDFSFEEMFYKQPEKTLDFLINHRTFTNEARLVFFNCLNKYKNLEFLDKYRKI